MNSIFIKNVTVEGRPSDIDIRDGRFFRIAPTGNLPIPEGVEILDAGGLVAFPGFINMHTHSSMSLMRGIAEDVRDLHEWLDDIWTLESKIDEDFIYWGTKVACLEMIKTGTTTFNDQYWIPDEACRAAREMGVRPVLSYVLLDHGDPSAISRQREECESQYERSLRWEGDAQFAVAPHAVYTVSESNLVWAAEFARKHGLKIHIHVSETQKEVTDCQELHGGLSPVEYLDRLGVLGPDVIAAHTLWLSDKDVEILGQRGVTCVHNINSNTKLASGYRFRYQELRDAGANVCLGTDGCASSNNLDMLEAMKTSAIIQKAWRSDPTALPLNELIGTATVNGAKALGLNAGRIAEGCLADFFLVDTDNTFFLSPAPFAANFIYSAHSDCICTVIRGGRVLMRDGQVEGEKDILHNAQDMLKKLINP